MEPPPLPEAPAPRRPWWAVPAALVALVLAVLGALVLPGVVATWGMAAPAAQRVDLPAVPADARCPAAPAAPPPCVEVALAPGETLLVEARQSLGGGGWSISPDAVPLAGGPLPLSLERTGAPPAFLPGDVRARFAAIAPGVALLTAVEGNCADGSCTEQLAVTILVEVREPAAD